ncbi:MAG: hypothetical protein MUO67_09045, partial [Anaerolineales bacterium]|nr:hypothetical protein [Anaerolineales bacterium]
RRCAVHLVHNNFCAMSRLEGDIHRAQIGHNSQAYRIMGIGEIYKATSLHRSLTVHHRSPGE